MKHNGNYPEWNQIKWNTHPHKTNQLFNHSPQLLERSIELCGIQMKETFKSLVQPIIFRDREKQIPTEGVSAFFALKAIETRSKPGFPAPGSVCIVGFHSPCSLYLWALNVKETHSSILTLSLYRIFHGKPRTQREMLMAASSSTFLVKGVSPRISG